MPANRSKLFKQRLLRGHVAVGIVCSLLLYPSVFFGMFAIFLPYFQAWEKPSRHVRSVAVTQIDYASPLAAVLADPDFPRDRIIVKLPGFGNDPALRISHQFAAETAFNPLTGERLEDEGKASDLAGFLNGLHYGKPLRGMGFILFGFVSVAALFATFGGLLLVCVLSYKKAGSTRQSIFSYWHRTLFLWCSPLFIIVVVSGSAMCLSFFGSGPMTALVTHGEHTNIRPVIGPLLFPQDERVAPEEKPTASQPIKELVARARQINPDLVLQQLTLINWGDATARIKLEGYNPYRPFLNGVVAKPSVILNAGDGNLVVRSGVTDRPWSVLLTDMLLSLHLLFGVNIYLRLAVFFIMLACCLAVGFGVMLWLEKKARGFRGMIPVYHWLGKLSLAVMLGAFPATGLLFNLQWLLPFSLPDRLVWQQGLFFDAWLATLAWSFYRLESRRAARDFLLTGGLLFLTAPILHSLRIGGGPFSLVRQQMWTILSVDVGLAFLGVLLLLASRFAAERPEIPAHEQLQRSAHA